MRLGSVIENLGYDTRHALRGMRHRPGFTAMVAGTLALGIGATVTMFGALDRLLLQPPERIADADHVVMLHVVATGHQGAQTAQPYSFQKVMREHVADFDDVAMFTPSAGGRAYYPVGRGTTAARTRWRAARRQQTPTSPGAWCGRPRREPPASRRAPTRPVRREAAGRRAA